VLAASLGIFACAGEKVVSPSHGVSRDALLQALTPEAALGISQDGRLQLAAPPSTGRAQITGEKAGALALGMARFNAPYNNSYYEARRGGPISYGKLRVCEPPLYAASPFERLDIDDPASAAHPLQKALGPVWLVRLCAGEDPQMNVAVAAYSTDLELNKDGSIDFPAIGGNDFFAEAIPIGHIADELPSAESAVVLAATSTGRRVSGVPELVAPFYRSDDPLESRWHLRLESPVRVRTSIGTFVESSDVYVSRVRETNRPGSISWSADAVQPASADVLFVPTLRVGENWSDYLTRRRAGTRTLHAARRVDMPIKFTAAVITQ